MTFSSSPAEGIVASPVGEILVEKSIAGWKEFELEVMRDVPTTAWWCAASRTSIPMGVHTGDSITVAPAQTLSDVEYQAMRDDAFAVLRRVGVETGGSNVQFAVNPDDRRAPGDRDEPSRESLERPGVQGHGISDRQDRRAAGGGLLARRNSQRHHRSHAREFRTGDRLRGDQDSSLGL